MENETEKQPNKQTQLQIPLQTLPHLLRTTIYYPLYQNYQTCLLLKQGSLKSDNKSISTISSSQLKNLSY